MPLEPNPVAFYLLAAMTLGSALGVVLARNLFHAGIALISCFLGVAGLYVTLKAPFLGAMQVLIYAGAIAVVLLFAFMLTHDLMHPKAERFQAVNGALTAFLVAVVLGLTAAGSPWAGPSQTASLAQLSDVKILAESYMKQYFLPFQLIAVILLVSLVGALVIARKEEEPKKP